MSSSRLALAFMTVASILLGALSTAFAQPATVNEIPNQVKRVTDIGQSTLMRQEVLNRLYENAKAAHENQSYFGWGVDLLKSLTQIYPEVKLRDNIPGAEFGLGLGTALENQRQAFWRMPESNIPEFIKNAEQSTKDNPGMAMQLMSAMKGQSTDQNLNNIFTLARSVIVILFIYGLIRFIRWNSEPAAKKPKSVVAEQATVKSGAEINTTVECSEWQVTSGKSGIEGPPPSEELSRTYCFSRLAPPERTATLRIVCDLKSEGLEGGLESEIGGSKLYRQVNFYLRPFRLPHEAAFVMGLSTVDQSRGGEFDVLAAPVDQDTSVFNKFCGRNVVRTCLEVMLSGIDVILTVSDKTESLVKFRLPNDGEFKQLYDEACDRLACTEVLYQVMRSNFRR